jgi:hypothetical protein
MRFSSRSLVVASTAVAALLLAACASHGVVPATNSFGPSVVSPEAVSPDLNVSPDLKKKPPCQLTQTAWVFAGKCGAVAIKAAGGKASMAIYDGFKIRATFPKANPAPSAGEILVVRDATNTKKDITGLLAGKAFPSFNKAGAPPTTVTPLLYMKAQNHGGGFTFTATPLLTVVSAKAFPGKDCILTKMNPSNDTWQAAPVVFGKITGTTVVFPEQTTQIPIPKNGTIYLAMACFNP